MKKYLLLVFFAACANLSFGQTLSSYGFTAFSGTFTPLIGGTVAPLTNSHNGYHNNIHIGFPFKYCGTYYDSISVSASGWAVLGYSASCCLAISDLSDALGTDAPRPLLAPLWTDLIFSDSLHVSYKTMGTFPYRKFVLEWKNAGYFPASTPAVESFQLILYESSNIIDFVYDSISTGFYSGSLSIGITGGSSSGSVAGLQPFWSLNDASASPTPSMTIDSRTPSTQQPATNQVYRWIPPCGLNPLPIGGTLTVCTTNTTSLTDTTGGTWSVFSTSIATVNSSTGVVTGVNPGVDTVYYTTSTGCSRLALLTVNPTPASITGVAVDCEWDSTRLSDVTPGGIWSSTNHTIDTVNDSGWVYAVSTGIDTIKYTVSTGCFVQKVYTVNVQPTAILGVDSVCVLATTSLTDLVTGGTWTSSTPTIATVAGTTGVVTGVGAGTTIISYTIGSCAVGTIVTVNPIPAAITGIDSVCEGATTSLTETSTTGFWSSSSLPNATVNSSGVVSGVSTGISNISYTFPITGCYVFVPVTVDITPASITGFHLVCVASAATLSDIDAGGTWVSSATSIATITPSTGIVSGVTGGTTTISYTIGMCHTSTTVSVNTLPLPISGLTSLCVNDTTSLANATSGGTWSSSNTAIATINSASGLLKGISGGVDTITYTIGTGCQVTYAITINALPAAILGANSVCDLATTTLTDATLGGTWTSRNNAIATVGGGTGIVTAVAVGTDTITYTSTFGCVISKTINVIPLPTPITGTNSFCITSGAITYTDGSGAGTWTSSTTTIATIGATTGIAGATGLGVDTITFHLTSTGCSVTKLITVDIVPTGITGPTSVCVGANITLADATGTGTWTSSASGIATAGSGTGAVGGVTSGNVTITYSLGSGCNTTYAVTVLPSPAAIGGPSSVCVTQGSVIESDITAGGTWSSSSVIANITLGGVVTGPGPGTGVVTISYTLPNTCFATKSFTVNTLPAAISGSNTVCDGTTITLADGTAGGTWSSSATGIATAGAGTGIIGGVVLGTATITYTLPTGCYATYNETVNLSAPAITGATFQVCQGSSITLNDATLGGTWSSSNAGIATVVSTTGVVWGATAGIVNIAYLSPSGCSATANVTVNPLPAAIGGVGSTCVGDNITLTDASGGGTWTSSNTAIATVSGGVVGGVATGIVTITYTLPTGCIVTKLITVNALPSPTTGPNNVCVGSVISLTNTTGGGTWSSGTTAIATTDLIGDVSGASAGSVIISYTLPTGCVAQFPVTINPLPGSLITPVGDTMMCPGTGFVLLNANTGVGLTYQWYNAGVNITGATTSTYLTTSLGIFSVFEVTAHGCTGLSPVLNVLIDTPHAAISPLTTTTFCSGTTLTLYANTGVGYTYQWSIGGVSIPLATADTYVAAIGGTYKVLVINATGCSAKDSVTITSIATPPATVTASGPLSFCVGGSVNLTATAGLYTYQWYKYGVIIPGATSNLYTATTTGDYTLTEINGSGCSATSATYSVTANVYPDATITAGGLTTFCSGGSVVLTAPFVAGYTYQWYNGGVAIAGANTFNYTATMGGTYTVLVSSGSGCSVLSSTGILVVVVASPTVLPLSPTSFCWGSSAVLGVDIVGGTGISYQWKLGGANIAGATNSTYTAWVPGSYSCQLSIAGSCATSTAVSMTITEFPLPNPVISWSNPYLVSQNYFVSYQWYRDATAIPGATNYNYEPSSNGNFKVAVTDTNGCQSIADIFVLTTYGVSTTGINNINNANSDIKVFPNPAQSLVQISSSETVKAKIVGLDGRTLIEQENAQQINISTLPNGTYILMLYNINGEMVNAQKLIKQSE